MSIRDVIDEFLEKANFANIASFVISLAGLYIAYTTGNEELTGVIIGAALTYLFKNQGSAS